jgi:hypothetical protein
MPYVVNRHHFRGKPLPDPHLYVGRGTPLGNPFKLSDLQPGEDRMVILDRYRRWLWEKIRENDAEVLAYFRRIKHETALVCSCAPKPCHADVIVRAWQWLQLRS